MKLLEAAGAQLEERDAWLAERDAEIASLKARVSKLEEQLAVDRVQYARTTERTDLQIIDLTSALAVARRCVESEAAALLAAEVAAWAAEEASAAAATAARRAQKLHEEARTLPEDPSFHVFIKELTGRTLVIKVGAQDTVEKVKQMVQNRTGILSLCFYLTFAGKALADGRLVSDYEILKDCTLTMCSRPHALAPVVPCARTWESRRSLTGREATAHALAQLRALAAIWPHDEALVGRLRTFVQRLAKAFEFN